MSKRLFSCHTSARSGPVTWRFGAMTVLWLLLVGPASMPGLAQTPDVLCNEGSGSFEATFRTGVKLHVGPAKQGGLATRICEAVMSWDQHSQSVEAGASQLDVDTYGVDLGLDVPVATLQMKKSSLDCCMTYQIYSLQKPSRPLRTITGGDFFAAADTDLDGRVEIWAHDAQAVSGFDGLVLSELDAPPTVVLRFEHGQLLDVSSEFQSFFDGEISKTQAKIDQQDLRDFKHSNGTLAPPAGLSLDQLHRMRIVKVKILELVWCYLYSGREQDAWRSLAEMWPAADVDRVRHAILDARAHGIRAQVDGVSNRRTNSKKKRVTVFDVTSERNQSEITPPSPIQLRRPPSSAVESSSPEAELMLDLVIDSAGKVRSAEPAGKARGTDTALLYASAQWKFIPASKAGRPVACRSRLVVSLTR